MKSAVSYSQSKQRGVKEYSAEKIRSYRILSIMLISTGIILGMALVGTSVYADFESMLFDIALVADNNFHAIQCPIYLSSNEIGEVQATASNKLDQPADLLVKAHISRGHLLLLREEEINMTIPANSQEQVSWEITPKDAAYGHLILVKMVMYTRSDDETSQKGSCGVIVLDLPGNMKGWQLMVGVVGMSLTTSLVGLRLWWKYGRQYSAREQEAIRSVSALAIILLVGLVAAMIGYWEVAAVAFYIGVLMIGVIVPHFLISR